MGLYKRCDCERQDDCEHAWWARFEIAGNEIRRTTRTASRRAAQVEERRLRAAAEGANPHRRSRRSVGLAELAGIDVARTAADGSCVDYQKALELVWSKLTKHFGADADPRTITYEAAHGYVLARRQTGALGQTIAVEVQALHRGLKEAHARGWLPFLPSRWPVVKRDGVRSKRRGKLHPPAVLAAWLRELPQYDRDVATVALLTSLRRAELHRITADWIEPAPDGVGVPAVLRIPAHAAKARKERVLPLAATALDALKRRIGETASGDLLFPRRCDWRLWERARARIGYPVQISLRDLRHTWGTLANRNVGIDAARDGLGHSTLAVTNRYVSGDVARTAQAALALESLVGTAEPAHGGEERKDGVKMQNAQSLNLGAIAAAHVLVCKRCAMLAVAHANSTVLDGDVGTAGSAQRIAALEPTP